MKKSSHNTSEYESDLQTIRNTVIKGFPNQDSNTNTQPFLIILSGLPGTGKSFFANRLTARIPSIVIESDRTRKALITMPTYSRKEHARVFAVCHKIIEELLSEGNVIIFDATNLTTTARSPLLRITKTLGIPSLCLAFTAPEEIIKMRLINRSSGLDQSSYSDADWNIYTRMKPWQEVPQTECWNIDSSKDISLSLNQLAEIIQPHK